MSKAISREHLILAQGTEYVRAELRRLLPKLPDKEQRVIGHLASVLTHSLKARRAGALNDLSRLTLREVEHCTNAVAADVKK
jgi:hypothetical protein